MSTRTSSRCNARIRFASVFVLGFAATLLCAQTTQAQTAQAQTQTVQNAGINSSDEATMQTFAASGVLATPTPTSMSVASPSATPHAKLNEAPTDANANATPNDVVADAIPAATPTSVPTPNPNFASPKSAIQSGISLSVLARRLKLPLPLPDARVVVLKRQRRLELWSGARLVKRYRVALGANPVGAKMRQHDSRTPEGHFRICTRNAVNSAFHIFLGLSYPGVPDAARGVNSGAISWREYALIQRKLASRAAPLWETRLGGWVGIHGGTDSHFARQQAQKRGRSDWTAGCVALTDVEIEEIYAATQMGTLVWIKP